MFSRCGGGLEQAFVDYSEGLRDRGHELIPVVCPGSVVQNQLLELGMAPLAMSNLGQWDILAVRRLRRKLEKLAPDIVIAHANRAYSLGRRAIGHRIPLVAVAHNYSTLRFTRAEAVFATTRSLINHLTGQGVNAERIFNIPNMVRCRELPHRTARHQPPVIGSMGRFVAKKGFDVYIEALKLLKERGHRFRALLGGSGNEEKALQKMAKDAGLEETLSFTGWVEDKRAFFTAIDIFCLPSLHEPFGIVLLEAFANGAPVVSTDSEGPSEIITPNYDALVVEKGDAEKLADALARLLDNPAQADSLAANAFAKTRLRYSTEVVAEQIEKALETIIERRK